MTTIQKTKAVQDAIGKVIEFKWTTSRGIETYGYNICTLRDRFGERLGKCSGGGYDMKGTSFGNWIERDFQAELLALVHSVPRENISWCIYQKQDGPKWERPAETRTGREERFYGLTVIVDEKGKEKVNLDGACGFESMRRVLQAIGLDIRWLHETKKTDLYEVVEFKPAA